MSGLRHWRWLAIAAATAVALAAGLSGTAMLTLALMEATQRSINTAYVGLIESIGTAAVADLASRAGIKSLPEPDAVGPSLAIGAYETSPLQMAEAYGMFANSGLRLHATPIASIEPDSLGIERVPIGPHERVVSTETAHLVTAALQGVVQRGTATAARFGRPLAAKTGTTNDYADAWLVGYSPQITTAVWVGHR